MGEQGLNAPSATVIAAVCALVGGVAGAGVKGWFDNRTSERAEALRAESALEIERLQVEGSLRIEERKLAGELNLARAKFETDLILRAIDTEDQNSAVKTLTFFAEAGLIPAYETRVLELARADSGAAIPTLRTAPDFQPIATLPAGGPLDPARVLELGRSVAAFAVNGRVVCTAVLVEPELGLVPDLCLVGEAEAEALGLHLDYDTLESEGESVGIVSAEAIGRGLTLLRLRPDDRLAGRGLPIAERAPEPGEALFMIHHPRGGPKQVSPGCFADREAPIGPRPANFVGDAIVDQVLNLVCRTEGGSAGAPVLAAREGTLLGIYVGRGADDAGVAIPVGPLEQAVIADEGQVEMRRIR